MTTLHSAYLVGLVGTGVTESLSPTLHMTEAKALGLSHVFRPIDLAHPSLGVDHLGDVLDWAELLGYSAMTVTHPCKQQVIPLLDDLDDTARQLGAVNTVAFTETGRVGYNTDTTGFESAFRASMPDAPLGRVVQIGTGGAGTAVADALARLGARELVLVDLDTDRASAVSDDLRTRRGTATRTAALDELPELLTTADGIVNCTPIGMHNHPGTPFDVALLRPDLWVADIVYRPLETELLREARRVGCQTLAGGHMAVFQAADAFEIITGVEPNRERMLAHFAELAAAESAATSNS